MNRELESPIDCLKMKNLRRRTSGGNSVLSWRSPNKLQQISFASVALVLLASFHHASGYGSGADPSVCDTMIPGHGPDPQTSPNPYKITVSKTAVQGFETVDITLTSKNGKDEFKGFLLQLRKPGENGKAMGEFKEVSEGNARQMNCLGGQNNAMTHTSGDLKKSVNIQWIAPNDEDAEYQIFYSVVGLDSDTYWTRIPHEEKIRVTRNVLATTTPTPSQNASDALLEKWRNVYNGCGKTKGCFGLPGKCIEKYDPNDRNPATCVMMVTWEKKGSVNMYQLTGRAGSSSGYIAVGMSGDSTMGSDSVVGCVSSSSTAPPTIGRYYNTESPKGNRIHSDGALGLKPQEKANVDGNLFCEFEQTNHKMDNIDINFDNNYYLLLSRGSGGASALGKHPEATDRDASTQSVHITDNIILGASANNWLIQLHGGLMVIAWLLCASTGTFTARYFKLTHTDFTPFGKAFWFALHVFCMAATVFLTICGSVFILIKKKGLDFTYTHPILGVIVVGLAILQVIIAFLRPHPGTPSRPYFNWFHWAVGNSAHIVGIVCILFANELPLADLQRFGDEHLWGWILLGIVLFHVLMHFVMSIHTLWADKQMDSNNKKRAMHPGPMKNNGLNTEAPGTAFRTFMLSLYLLVMAAGAIVLVALVFWPKSVKEDDTAAPTS